MLRYGSESVNIEFKRSERFEDLQFHIAKTAQAMANLRDGGFIIVGVAQVGKAFKRDGVTPDHEASYQVEAIFEFVNRYASPPIDLRVLPVEFEGKRFVAIVIPPFERTPVVCQRDTPPNAPRKMKKGEVYVRSSATAKIETTKVTSAPMMEELLQRAAGLRLAETIQMLRAGGLLIESPAPGDPLQKEVEDLADLL
jgi:predicted HTH transcriptional regulator